MNFLRPLFLLGALAVGLPVVFHLIRRTTRDRTPFSSLMFLLPTPPRLTRRSRLEHLLLLFLRCLVLCLLAVGFARPFLRKAVSDAPQGAAARRVILLVDTSASMRRGDLWQQARERADAFLHQTSPLDEAAVFTFDRQLNPIMSFDQWKAAPSGQRVALAAGKLAELSPGWSGTELGHALISAAELLADTGSNAPAGRRQIVLVTDLQEGCRLGTLQGYEWPRGIELSVQAVSPKRSSNASLQLVNDAEDAGPKSAASVRVRVSNAPDSKREQFRVGWARADGQGFAAEPSSLYVSPGQSRILALSLPAATQNVDRIILQGDDEEFDNTVFAVPPETQRLNVLYFGNDSAQDPKQPLYFLERAFQETRRQAVQVLARSPGSPNLETEARAAAVLFITGALPEAGANTLHEEIAAGKTALVTLRSDAAAATLARLIGLDHLGIEEAHPNNYAMLAEIDFRHPLFAPFADPRFSDFTKIHFWKYRRLDASAVPGARMIAKFDSGDPALVEAPVGKGRVFILTSGWDPADSQLALSTKFVPLLYSLLETAGAAAPSPAQYKVGDSLPLAQDVGSEKDGPGALAQSTDRGSSIRLPDGSETKLAIGQTNFSRTLMPGIYTLVSPAKTQRFAVNLDPEESRTAPLSVDELERLGAPVSLARQPVSRELQRKVLLQNTELESRQKLWRWFLLAALGLVCLETWLAGRTARRWAQAAQTARAE